MKINQSIERKQSWKVTPRDQYIEVEVYATDEHDWHTARLLPASGIDFGAALVQAGRVAQDAQRDREARKADIKLQLSPNAREFVETIERQQRDAAARVHIAQSNLNRARRDGDPDWEKRAERNLVAAQEILIDTRNTPKLATGGQVIGDGSVLGTDSSGRQYTEQVKPITTESIAIERVAPLLTELTKRVNAADLTNPASSAQARVALEQLTTGAIKRALAAFPTTPTADGASDV